MNISYVPILNWKAAERGALKGVYGMDRIGMVPLVGLPRTDAMNAKDRQLTPSALRSKVVTEVHEHWGHYEMFFDLRPLGDDDRAALRTFFSETRTRECKIIPVTRLGRPQRYHTAVFETAARSGYGTCLRLTADDLSVEDFPDRIDALLRLVGVRHGDVHLVVDVGSMGALRDYAQIVGSLPNLNAWHSLTIAGGSFPKDLSHLDRDRKHSIPRLEWTAWKELVDARILRRPIFGDYSVLHPVLTSVMRAPNASASIRYTGEEAWVVMRGKGLRSKNGRGYKQYPAQAELLRNQADFRGSSYSAGDEYISQIASGEHGTGNLRTWLQAGINQHLTYVRHQIVSHTTALDTGASAARPAAQE